MEHIFRDLAARRYLRGWNRSSLAIPATIAIRLEDGRTFTRGTAMVRDISLKGACLAKLVLRKQALPAAQFRIHLEFKPAEYRGIGATCRPVRFGGGPDFELAVEFEDFWVRVDKRR